MTTEHSEESVSAEIDSNQNGLGDRDQVDDVGEVQPVPSVEEEFPTDWSSKEHDSDQTDDDDVVEWRMAGRTFRGLFSLVALLLLIVIGVTLRLVLSSRHSSQNDKPIELTKQEEAARCFDRGCLNLNCLRINACHTDPDAAYCADYECVNTNCPTTGECAIGGRPFRDSLSSKPLLAETTMACHDCPWSSSTKSQHPQTLNLNVVSTWSERAVGEHASIASFSAFVIALLTHRAPPILIADALQAAADELRHAQLAFGRATAANGGNGLGPSGLPESHLDFSYDLTKLAQAVAQEGCIDETLSALELAVESQNDNDDRDLLWEIAKDEARHSLLAWRTLQWVCSQDGTACQTTFQTVLHPDRVAHAVEARFGGRPQSSFSLLNDAWRQIARHLIPSVRDQPVELECPTHVSGVAAVDTLAMDIVKGFCQPVMSA
uniref:Ferritin-like domain-containing protein n=1 Tax=Amphora coffeiformis TaxID=265554 RepID=A0A7S3PB80_9STRA